MRTSPGPRPLMACLVVAAALAAACSTPKDVVGFAGTYVMSQRWNADTLQLRADGRWVRRFTTEGKPQVTDSGAWFLTRDARLIGFKAFPKRWAFVHDLMGDTTSGRVLTVPATLSLTVSRARLGMGDLRLGWHPEFNWWYVRIGD